MARSLLSTIGSCMYVCTVCIYYILIAMCRCYSTVVRTYLGDLYMDKRRVGIGSRYSIHFFFNSIYGPVQIRDNPGNAMRKVDRTLCFFGRNLHMSVCLSVCLVKQAARCTVDTEIIQFPVNSTPPVFPSFIHSFLCRTWFDILSLHR